MSVPTYDITPPDPRRENRRNAREHIQAGVALAGGGTTASLLANRAVRRKLGYKPSLKAEIKGRLRPKHLGVKLGARSAQITGLGLAAAGVKHLVRPDEKIDPVSVKEDIARPMARAATFQNTSKALLPKPRPMRTRGQLIPAPRSTRAVGVGQASSMPGVSKAGFTGPVRSTARIKLKHGVLERKSKQAPLGFVKRPTFAADTKGNVSAVAHGTADVGDTAAFSAAPVAPQPQVRDRYQAKIRKDDWTHADQDKLSRRRRTGRALSVAGGTMGLGALALRTPGGAKALVNRGVKSGVLRRIAAHEPAATGHSNTLGVLAIGTGSAGSFNYASQQKLERRKERALEIGKAQSHLSSELVNRVSPQAEASYNRMHADRRVMRAESAGQGALAGILGASTVEQIRHGGIKSRWGIAASTAGTMTTAYGALRSAKQARGRTRAMHGIEAAGRRRARAKQYGIGRGKSPVDPTSRARNLASAAPRST